VLALASGSIYLIPYTRYAFYDYQIKAMGISNTQIGLLSTAYGIAAMILYIPGGVLADKFSSRKLISGGLLLTTLFTVIYAFTSESYGLAVAIWVVFAVTTVFISWSAIMKAVRLCGTSDQQGFMFGLYYCIQGITGGIINAIAIWVSDFGGNMTTKFFYIVIVYAASTAVAGILAFIVIRDEEPAETVANPEEKFQFSQAGRLLKSPKLWLLAIIVFCGYSIYSSTTYFTPYLTNVVGVSPQTTGFLSIFRTNFAYVFAPLSGLVADKLIKSTSKWFIIMYAVMAVMFAGIFLIPGNASVGFVSFYTILPGIIGLAIYSITFSIATEIKIPVIFMGTAIGIASVIGYTPDIFMPTMFGNWLDKFGNTGYNYIFCYLIAVCIIAAVISCLVRISVKKDQKNRLSGNAELQ